METEPCVIIFRGDKDFEGFILLATFFYRNTLPWVSATNSNMKRKILINITEPAASAQQQNH